MELAAAEATDIPLLAVASAAEPTACTWNLVEAAIFAAGTYLNATAIQRVNGKHRVDTDTSSHWHGESTLTGLLELPPIVPR
ncbi:hypothetical protein [Kutzneria buriramensis]|uniref:hypothetical protein n=1 Tax=Kutzneria buriramensis TaxID=1045776 RepID=UPI000E2397EC|nr:hypothetical protein [Kutzneria buriramensis]